MARRRVAEQLGAAFGAEAAAHGVAAVRGADILGDLAAEREACSLEDRVDRGVAGGEVLAIAAPAGAQRDRWLAELETDGAAEAAAFDRLGHCDPFVVNLWRGTIELDSKVKLWDFKA